MLSLNSLDTIGKVKRKEMLEARSTLLPASTARHPSARIAERRPPLPDQAQLAQIEKDIEKLAKKVVYVRHDEC